MYLVLRVLLTEKPRQVNGRKFHTLNHRNKSDVHEQLYLKTISLHRLQNSPLMKPCTDEDLVLIYGFRFPSLLGQEYTDCFSA